MFVLVLLLPCARPDNFACYETRLTEQEDARAQRQRAWRQTPSSTSSNTKTSRGRMKAKHGFKVPSQGWWGNF
jgi:hypothetical protein